MQKPSANLVLLYIIGCNIMSFLTLLSTALNCILLVLKFMKQSVSIMLHLLIRVTHSKQYFVWHIFLLKPLSLQYQYAYSPYCSFCISSGVDQGNLFKNQDHLFCSCDRLNVLLRDDIVRRN